MGHARQPPRTRKPEMSFHSQAVGDITGSLDSSLSGGARTFGSHLCFQGTSELSRQHSDVQYLNVSFCCFFRMLVVTALALEYLRLRVVPVCAHHCPPDALCVGQDKLSEASEPG